MLPPVQSVSNSQVSYQEHRPPHARENLNPTVAQPPLPVAPPGVEQNSVIAGKLSLLLLSGQERMSANLVVLADLLGRALGIQRRDTETNAAFSSRLIEALARLSPAEAARVEQQLSKVFSGVQLRMVVEAFRNPAGPDAAKLAVFLELARYKDRDLAARTVVTSYRQYSGEPRMLSAGLPSTVFLAQEQAALRAPAALPASDEDGQRGAPAEASAGEQGDFVVRPPADPLAKSTALSGLAERLPAAADSNHSLATVQPPQPDRESDEPLGQSADVPLQPGDDGSANSDIRILQERLRRNFEDGHQAGFSDHGTDRAGEGSRDGGRTAALHGAEPDADIVDDGREIADRQAPTPARAASAAEERDAGKALQRAGADDQHASPLTDAPDEIPQRAPPERATAIAAPLAEPEGALPADQGATGADQPRDAGMPINKSAEETVLAEPDAARAGTGQAQDGHPAGEATARPATLPDAELALLRQGIVPQGLPFPFINYAIAPEYDTGSARNDAGRRFEEGSDGEEEAAEDEFADAEDGSAGQSPDDGGEDAEAGSGPHVVMLGDSPVLAITHETPVTNADRVTDLYGRMADWA